MSNLPLPNELKTINPYLLRAKELASKAPFVAYYTKAYAAQVAVSIYQQITNGNTNQAEYKGLTQYMMKLMDELEEEKKQLNPNPDEGKGIVELYALKMFSKADAAYRGGRKDQIVAKLFYASSIIIETTKQFSELSDDLKEKQKYARAKAAEIFKSSSSISQQIEQDNEQQENQEVDQPMSFSANQIQANKPSMFAAPQPTMQPIQQIPQPQKPPVDVSQLEREQMELVKQHTALYQRKQEILQQQAQLQQAQQQQQQQQQTHSPGYYNPIPTQFGMPKTFPTTNQNEQGFQKNMSFQNQQQQQQKPAFPNSSFRNVPPPAFEKPEKIIIDQEEVNVKPIATIVNESNDKTAGVVLDKIFEAEKMIKQAQSALQFTDVPTAREKLRRALELLQ